MLFDAEGEGTRVRVVADLDEEGLHWLMRRRGYPVREPASGDDHPICECRCGAPGWRTTRLGVGDPT